MNLINHIALALGSGLFAFSVVDGNRWWAAISASAAAMSLVNIIKQMHP